MLYSSSNIVSVIKSTWREGVEWIGQGLLVGSCIHGNEPWGSIEGGEFLTR
jgi:hypothetical protein